MSLAGVLVAAVGSGLLATLVPRLIAWVPEPDEPAEDKVTYAEIASRRGLAWQAALGCALVGALVGLAVGLDWALIFLMPLVPVGFALALIDWRTRLLPTRIIAPTYAVLIPLVVVAAVASGEPGLLKRAALGWLVLGGFYVLLWVVHPRGMGYGDVRLSGILGIVLGYLGWGSVVLGGWAAFLLGGLGGTVLAAARLIDRKNNPFGPWMLIGTLIGIVLGPAFADWMWGDLSG